MKQIIAIVMFFAAIILGLATGIGIFSTGIYMIVLMAKGAIGIGFLSIAGAVLCWILAAPIGYLVWFLTSLAAVFLGFKD